MTYLRGGISLPLTRPTVTIPAVYSTDAAARFGCRRAVKWYCFAVAQNNDWRLLFDVKDENGLVLDVSDASAITVYVARNKRKAPAGADLTWTLSGNGVVLGIGSQFYVDMSTTQTGGLTPGKNYYEATVVLNGSTQTVAAGDLWLQDTIYGDS